MHLETLLVLVSGIALALVLACRGKTKISLAAFIPVGLIIWFPNAIAVLAGGLAGVLAGRFFGVAGSVFVSGTAAILLSSLKANWFVYWGCASLCFMLIPLVRTKGGFGLAVGGVLVALSGLFGSQMVIVSTTVIGLGFALCTLHDENRLHKKHNSMQKDIDSMVDTKVKKRVSRLNREVAELAMACRVDPLTGALNKTALYEAMEIETRTSQVFSILVFDIDKFKRINDTFGHQAGDDVLMRMVDIAKGCMRSGDNIGRYGGDEFSIVIPNADSKTAFRVAERFRSGIEQSNGKPKFTVSIGYATYPVDGETVDDLIGAADAGLYNAKRFGRNKVAHHAEKRAEGGVL